jgi:hypothetical protein
LRARTEQRRADRIGPDGRGRGGAAAAALVTNAFFFKLWGAVPQGCHLFKATYLLAPERSALGQFVTEREVDETQPDCDAFRSHRQSHGEQT